MPKIPKFAVTATCNGKRVELRRFEEEKYARRFKNLVKVLGQEIPAPSACKNPRIKKL